MLFVSGINYLALLSERKIIKCIISFINNPVLVDFMINLHLYRSTFINESRVNREISTLEELNIFKEIHLVGVNNDELPKIEKISKSTTVFRFLRRRKNDTKLIIGTKIFLWYLVVLIKYWNKDLKCINCHSVNVLPISVILKFISGSKLIYDAHELETETSALAGITKFMAKFIEKNLIQFCDFSIFVSKSTEEWYLKEYSLINTMHIYNCTTYKQSIESDYLNRKFDIDKGKKIFLYQGMFAEERGLEKLLDIFSEPNIDSPIVFLGFGKLESLIKEFAMKNKNIYFHEAVSSDEIHMISSSAQIGIALVDDKYLNHQYCLPNKLFEYIMSDLPVLVSSTYELDNFVRGHNIGISCNFNKTSILKSIKKIVINYDSYKNNLENVRKNYNFNIQKLKLINLYKSFDL